MDRDSIFKEICEKSNDGVLFCDTSGIIKIWNRGCQIIFGYDSDEAIGKSLDIIIPEKYKKRHWDGFFNVVKSKKTKYSNDLLSVPANTKYGRQISIEFTIAMIEEKGNLLGFAAIIRDSTTNFLAQKELKKRVKELESLLESRK